jgi:hypothetical protein
VEAHGAIVKLVAILNYVLLVETYWSLVENILLSSGGCFIMILTTSPKKYYFSICFHVTT